MMSNEMETQDFKNPAYAYVIHAWKPDMARFHAEVRDARLNGTGDPLTLAEMECSLDLIDADLAAMRAGLADDDRTKQSISEATLLRNNLAMLIEQLRPLATV